ncbi:ABC transporter ATP-binding protein [Macrococcoides canis]|uniref:ABC transporter ATP-binding protein n=1 Tax=Macrococcoides canis TaxID=1855823 RepID=UPI001B8D5EFA|nr:ABC transporter ATP-binding protein [Macrococcus canis]QUR94245.1 ATP-binding cassette domain-containing protein [Macrococcus canis]UTH07241.1 ABC transporter ATP-binding protein [Macrococcus canis]
MSIELKNIQMQFKDATAVNNLNVTIPKGSLVSILGPSGCGKSTTLFMIAGLHEPTRGQILFDGKDVTSSPPEKRNIGMVFQNYALYPHMTVLKNIMFPLKMQKVPKKEMKTRAIEAARLVEIEHLLNRKPGELSGGQQQRVAIARALVREPEVLLLDEPLSNLDAKLRLTMREEIREIQQRLKITTLFVTHDQEEALSISDYIMLMKDGILMQYATPNELYESPETKFAAEFIGSPSINSFPVNEETIKHLLNGTHIQGATTIGIRPEDMNIDETQTGLKVIVKLVEQIGRDKLVTVETDEGTRAKIFIHKDKQLNIDEIIHIKSNAQAIKVFDEEGRRV